MRDRLQVPSAAEVIELPGVTLLPGLIDMHTHLDADPTLGGFTWISLPDAYAAIVSVPNARATLEAGFTTVRNVGSGNWDDIALKAAIENGKVPGPRIVPAGYSFGATRSAVRAWSAAVPRSFSARLSIPCAALALVAFARIRSA